MPLLVCWLCLGQMDTCRPLRDAAGRPRGDGTPSHGWAAALDAGSTPAPPLPRPRPRAASRGVHASQTPAWPPTRSADRRPGSVSSQAWDPTPGTKHLSLINNGALQI